MQKKNGERKLKKVLAIVSLLLILSTIGIPFASGRLIVDGRSLPDYIPVYENDPRAGEMEKLTFDGSGAMTWNKMTQLSSTPSVGTTVYDWYLGVLTGDPWITLKAKVGKAEVWLAENLLFPAGDPRNDDPRLTPPDELLEYMAYEFNDIIYPIDTAHFTTPADRDGTWTIFEQLGWPSYTWDWINAEDDPQRVIIKVLNIQDENWEDPDYPYYVVGFFSSGYTEYYNRNMVHLDSWDWQDRVGPDVARPYVYDSTLAHEYQHNIHYDAVPGDSDYMNEGCSMYAEMLCGYGVSWSHVNSSLYTPDNSLTKWGDQGDINILADYGQALLWALYLEDNYSPPGESFVSHYMEAGIPAEFGINAALAYFESPKTFDDVYYEWNLANYLHSAKKSPYTYNSLDLNPESNPNVDPMNVHQMKPKFPMSFYGSDFGSTITILGYDTGVIDLAPYSSDYILFEDWDSDAVLYFDGGEASEIAYGWELIGRGKKRALYSDGTDLLNTLIAANAYVDPSDPELEITTYWDIEDYWDFGFVQVSNDGGLTWASLANEYTEEYYDPAAYFEIVANLPGLTSWSEFITKKGWVTMNFDLSAYAGENVMIGFRYMTDWGTTYEGWYISNVQVSGTDIPLDSFEKVVIHPSHFTVTIAYLKGNMVENIQALNIDHSDETGQIFVPGNGQDVLVIVSNPSDPTLFLYGTSDYHIAIEKA